MKHYKHTEFYNPMDIEDLEMFKVEVIAKTYDIRLEQKYVQGRWREPTDKSLDYILNGCNEQSLVRVSRQFPNFPGQVDRGEVVFMTRKPEWYMAWCSLRTEDLYGLVDKYNLRRLV